MTNQELSTIFTTALQEYQKNATHYGPHVFGCCRAIAQACQTLGYGDQWATDLNSQAITALQFFNDHCQPCNVYSAYWWPRHETAPRITALTKAAELALTTAH